ncbi:TldD/PmbA family protein [Coprothermobacter platensis]|uniref:TldD/PmbA family protein n=1 Tax=Coprothermobacter platensis TaxID=108819 RepID=UPI00037132CE|nr:TldD/PmbA family protein [Coprothermobacter platensis]
MFTQEDLERVAQELLTISPDFFDIFVEERTNKSLVLESKKLERPSVGTVFGASIRAVVNGATYFSVVDNPSLESLIVAAKELSSSVKQTASNPGNTFILRKVESPLKKDEWKQWSQLSEVADYLKATDDYARSYDSKVAQVSSSVSQQISNVQVLNSLGNFTEEQRSRTRVFCLVYASDGSSVEVGSANQGKMGGLELLQKYSPEFFAASAAKVAVSKLKGVVAPSGELPVILGPGFGGVIFHEAIGHSLEADAIRKEVSVMRGKIGQRLASSKVTLIDSGIVPGEWGSNAFDDEGFPNQETVLIKEGQLVSYMSDYLEHLLTGFPHTANGRREGYEYIPYPRMRNTYIQPGNDTFEDMLTSIKKGILALKFGGGQVDPVTGNFIFGVTEGYLIEDGKVTAPIKDVSMVGNGLSILENIEAVSSEKDMDFMPGMCGKEGQSVAAGIGEPYVKVSRILIGGE